MLPKAHLTHNLGCLTLDEWPHHRSYPGHHFWYSSVNSCHLFLISSASVRSLPFQAFIVPIFAWSIPLAPSVFLKRSLVFLILLFSSVSLHCSLQKPFLSLLASLWNSAFRLLYLSLSSLPLPSFLSYFPFLYFFFFGMVLIITSCTMLETSVHIFLGSKIWKEWLQPWN